MEVEVVQREWNGKREDEMDAEEDGLENTYSVLVQY